MFVCFLKGRTISVCLVDMISNLCMVSYFHILDSIICNTGSVKSCSSAMLFTRTVLLFFLLLPGFKGIVVSSVFRPSLPITNFTSVRDIDLLLPKETVEKERGGEELDLVLEKLEKQLFSLFEDRKDVVVKTLPEASPRLKPSSHWWRAHEWCDDREG